MTQKRENEFLEEWFSLSKEQKENQIKNDEDIFIGIGLRDCLRNLNKNKELIEDIMSLDCIKRMDNEAFYFMYNNSLIGKDRYSECKNNISYLYNNGHKEFLKNFYCYLYDDYNKDVSRYIQGDSFYLYVTTKAFDDFLKKQDIDEYKDVCRDFAKRGYFILNAYSDDFDKEAHGVGKEFENELRDLLVENVKDFKSLQGIDLSKVQLWEFGYAEKIVYFGKPTLSEEVRQAFFEERAERNREYINDRFLNNKEISSMDRDENFYNILKYYKEDFDKFKECSKNERETSLRKFNYEGFREYEEAGVSTKEFWDEFCKLDSVKNMTTEACNCLIEAFPTEFASKEEASLILRHFYPEHKDVLVNYICKMEDIYAEGFGVIGSSLQHQFQKVYEFLENKGALEEIAKEVESRGYFLVTDKKIFDCAITSLVRNLKYSEEINERNYERIFNKYEELLKKDDSLECLKYVEDSYLGRVANNNGEYIKEYLYLNIL